MNKGRGCGCTISAPSGTCEEGTRLYAALQRTMTIYYTQLAYNAFARTHNQSQINYQQAQAAYENHVKGA